MKIYVTEAIVRVYMTDYTTPPTPHTTAVNGGIWD